MIVLIILIIISLLWVIVLVDELSRGNYTYLYGALFFAILISIGWDYYYNLEKKELIVVNETGYKVIMIKVDDKRVNNIWDDKLDDQVFIQNISNSDIFIKSHSYRKQSTYSKPNYGPERIIEPNEIISYWTSIDYIFKPVPNKIRTQQRILNRYELSRSRGN